MAVTVEWFDEEPTIIRALFTGKWTVEEWARGIAEANELAIEANNPVYVIFEYRSPVDYLPPGLLRNLHLGVESPLAANPLVLRLIVVRKPELKLSLAHQVFRRMYTVRNTDYLNSLEEALEHIARLKASRD
jgi:hypothetical protein